MSEQKIKFIGNVVKWFDRVNGNTYHSVKITRTADGAEIASCDIVYGYGEQYRHTALELMVAAKWLPKKYNIENAYSYERENNYPIFWAVSEGTKRQMKENVN